MPVLSYTKQVIMCLFDYVNIINNTHSQRGYLPGAGGGGGAGSSLCNQAGGLSLR